MKINLRLRRVIADREPLPRWYGIAEYGDFGRVMICYPLGLHRLVPVLRRVWWALHWPGYIARMERAEAERHYEAGYRAGHAAAVLDILERSKAQ